MPAKKVTTEKDTNTKTQASPFAEQVPSHENFVDGFASVSIRQGVAKLDFYQTFGQNEEEKTEKRRLSQRIILPVNGLVELNDTLSKMIEQIKNATESKPKS